MTLRKGSNAAGNRRSSQKAMFETATEIRAGLKRRLAITIRKTNQPGRERVKGLHRARPAPFLGEIGTWALPIAGENEAERSLRFFTRGLFSSKAKVGRMRATSLAVLTVPSVLSLLFAVLAAAAVSEDTGVGPPPALPPAQAPLLPKPGPLAEPRSQDQVSLLPTSFAKPAPKYAGRMMPR